MKRRIFEVFFILPCRKYVPLSLPKAAPNLLPVIRVMISFICSFYL